jgi:hypothetical protein
MARPLFEMAAALVRASSQIPPPSNDLRQDGSSRSIPPGDHRLELHGRRLLHHGPHYPVPVYGDVFVSDPYHLNEYRISGKFDHKFSDQDQLTLYLMQDAESGDPINVATTPLVPFDLKGRTNIGIGWNHLSHRPS